MKGSKLNCVTSFFSSTFPDINPCLSILLSCSGFLSSSSSSSSQPALSRSNTHLVLIQTPSLISLPGVSWAETSTLVDILYINVFFPLTGPEKWERVHQAETCPWQFLWRRASHLHQLQQERPILPVGLDPVYVHEWVAGLINVAFEGQR